MKWVFIQAYLDGPVLIVCNVIGIDNLYTVAGLERYDLLRRVDGWDRVGEIQCILRKTFVLQWTRKGRL